MEINDIKNYSKITEDATNIFNQNIEMLKGWREIFWETSFKDTSAFVAPNLGNICESKEDLTYMKKFVSQEIFDEFIKEHDMTIYLINKCLIKAVNEQLLPTSREDKIKIEEIISKTSILIDEFDDLEKTVECLRKEDQTTQKFFESTGLDEDRIKTIIESGHRVDSVLDVELKNNLRK